MLLLGHSSLPRMRDLEQKPCSLYRHQKRPHLWAISEGFEQVPCQQHLERGEKDGSTFIELLVGSQTY